MTEISDWVILPGRSNTTQDIDALLSASEDDYHGTAQGYVARISCALFADAVTPPITGSHTEWEKVAYRLNGKNLILIMALPSPFELTNSSAYLDLISIGPIRYQIDAEGHYAFSAADPDEAASIRQTDLTHIVRRHQKNAILNLNGGHFSLPSGAHTSHFFRLAECLTSEQDIDSLVYWIALDFWRAFNAVPDEPRILLLVDNPSIFVLAIRLIQLFPKYRIKCESLSAYPDANTADDHIETWVHQHISDVDQIYWLVGVSSTGILSTAIQNAAGKFKKSFASSALYATTPGLAGQTYCDLAIDDYYHVPNSTECMLCNPGAPVFQIDKARYFVSQRHIHRTSIPPALFQPQKSFIEKYGAQPGILLNHIDSPNDGKPRHHSFYVDVSKLLKREDFRAEILAKLSNISPPPDVIVLPSHATGEEIGNFLRENCVARIFLHPNLRLDLSAPEEAELARAISAAQSLLIVDDVAFTGSRLQIFNRSMREANGAYKTPPNVTFFPLITIPEDWSKWQKMERGIISQHPGQLRNIIYLYSLILPFWGRDACPWCNEELKIQKLDLFSDSESDSRGIKLGKRELGLASNDWINAGRESTIPNFGAQSYILDEGALGIQTLFSCASAIQQARTGFNPKFLLDPTGFPKSTVLDSAVVEHYYTEMLILVSLLRCLRRDEVDDDFRKFVMNKAIAIARDQNHVDRWALRELLLASKRGLASRIEDAALRREVYEAANFTAFEAI